MRSDPPFAGQWRISSVTKSAAKHQPDRLQDAGLDAVALAAKRLAREEHRERRQAEAEDQAVQDRPRADLLRREAAGRR